MKELVRPWLAKVFAVTLCALGILQAIGIAEPPEWILGMGGTVILWWFGSRQKEKANAQKAV